MLNFTGTYDAKLDAKGRIVLPSKIKTQLPESENGSIVIRKGFEACLEIYPKSEWNKELEKISRLNSYDRQQRNLKRNLLARVTEVDIDNMGRFLIPKNMKEHARLESQVKVMGAANIIEIWNPALWEEEAMSEEQLSAMSEKFLSEPDQNQISE